MALFYTGKGDKGYSKIGKKEFPKDSPILEMLGELDEFNSLLGLVRASAKNKKLAQKLKAVQENLFIIQANVAWFLYPKFQAPKLRQEKIEMLEKEIEEIEKRIKPVRGFIIPGNSNISAWVDFLRAVCRRTERRMFKFSRKYKIGKEILVYLNRLSSYLFALARQNTFKHKIKESRPTYI